MMKSFLWMGLSILLVAAMVLSSCGGTTEGEQEEEEEEAVGEEEVQLGGTLTVLKTADTPAWTPTGGAQSRYTGVYFESLVGADIETYGPRGTNEYAFQQRHWVPEQYLMGRLTDSWEIQTDPLQIVFHIREGLMWQGGDGTIMEPRPVVADDLVKWFDIYDSTPQSGFNHHGGYCTDMVEIDEETVALEMAFYNASWHFLTGWGWCCPIYPPELIEAGNEDWQNHVGIGTGPFLLEDYVQGSQAVYTKNPNYWDKTTINGKEYQCPLVDEMVWAIITDMSTAVSALRTGKVDWWDEMEYQYKDTILDSVPEMQYYDLPASRQMWASMRCDNPDLPFYDINVRRAMNIAVDNQAVNEAMYGKGAGDVYTTPFNHNLPEGYPFDELPEEAQELWDYNPDEARRLLAEAGYATGFDTHMHIDTQTYMQDGAAALVDYWADVGVNVELIVLEPAALSSMKVNHQQDEMLMGGMTASLPVDGIKMVGVAGGVMNQNMMPDDGFYDWWKEMGAELDMDKRIEMMHEQIEWIFTKQVGDVYLGGNYTVAMAWPWIKNWYGEVELGYVTAMCSWMRLWIDQDLKEEMGY